MSNGAGKGSRYRPVNKKLYDRNYEKIFGAKKKREEEFEGTLSDLLSDKKYREETGLPNCPEECDFNMSFENTCVLERAKNNCGGCLIGRKKRVGKKQNEKEAQSFEDKLSKIKLCCPSIDSFVFYKVPPDPGCTRANDYFYGFEVFVPVDIQTHVLANKPIGNIAWKILKRLEAFRSEHLDRMISELKFIAEEPDGSS